MAAVYQSAFGQLREGDITLGKSVAIARGRSKPRRCSPWRIEGRTAFCIAVRASIPHHERPSARRIGFATSSRWLPSIRRV